MTFLIFSIFFLREGIPPLVGYKNILLFGFDPGLGLNQTVRRSVPFLFFTLGIIIPLKGGLWNIGGQGQFYMGAIGATGTAFVLSNQPPYILIPVAMIVAAGFGAGWGGLVGVVKGKIDINEIVMTVMLNFVALYTVKSLIEGGPWMCPAGRPESSLITSSAAIPEIGHTGIPCTIFIAIGLAIFFFFFFKRNKLGFEIETVGKDPQVAREEGINLTKVSIIIMLIAGALAGLGGYHQSVNVIGRLRPDLSPAWGFYALVPALLARKNCIAAIFISFFMTGILVGVQALQFNLGMTFGSGFLFFGLLISIMTIFQFFYHYEIKW